MEECKHIFKPYYGRETCILCKYTRFIHKPTVEEKQMVKILQRKREYIMKIQEKHEDLIPEDVTQTLNDLDNSEPSFEINKRYNDLAIQLNESCKLSNKKCSNCIDCQCSLCMIHKINVQNVLIMKNGINISVLASINS